LPQKPANTNTAHIISVAGADKRFAAALLLFLAAVFLAGITTILSRVFFFSTGFGANISKSYATESL
jgi:hypothetical protein